MVLMNFVSDTPRCPSSNSGSKFRIIGSPLIAPSAQSSKLVKFVLFVKFCTNCRASCQGGIRSGLRSSVKEGGKLGIQGRGGGYSSRGDTN